MKLIQHLSLLLLTAEVSAEVFSSEGRSVTLSCTYSAVTLGCQYNSRSTNDYLFWYKQDGNNSPKFILSRFKVGTGVTVDEEKFSSTLNSSLRSVPLKIQKLQLSDSAVYYCALRPTVTGNTKICTKTFGAKTTQYSTTSTRGRHTLLNFR
uniref:Ig-like domain-containing protein n=1 Tax=Sander lucioperca TaxID=283035 RepID=A0A8D0D8R9_SANLU